MPQVGRESEKSSETGAWRAFLGLGRSRRLRRYVGRAFVVLIALAAAALVSFVTVDLGPAVRGQAERAASSQLARQVKIGRLGTYLLPGRFVIEDLVIDGLQPGDEPFFQCAQIVVSTSWMALLRGEVLIDSVEMGPWRMVAESFADGRQSFPRFVPERADEPPSGEPPGSRRLEGQASSSGDQPGDERSARRIVTTVQYLRAHDGEFVFRDHGAPWSVVARNVDLNLEKRDTYGGEVSFTGGTVSIRDFEPMAVDMGATYALDGGQVALTHIDLALDGFQSTVTGDVDLLNWPEQTYHIVESEIDLPTMKDVFFGGDPFTVDGDARLSGTWHIYDGGRDLTGRFESEQWWLNGFAFPNASAALTWTDDRFEVSDYHSGFYGGEIGLEYTMAPLGREEPGTATLETTVTSAGVAALGDAVALKGARPEGSVSGRGRLAWPLGRFAEHVGEGRLTVAPPTGTVVMTPSRQEGGVGGAADYATVPFDPDAGPWTVPVGGEVGFTVTSGVVDFVPSRLATPRTVLEFDGRTDLGDDSRIAFRATSADWQESDRLMSAVMTAVGRPTSEVRVGGQGTLEGLMLGAFAAPRIEARFDGENIQAWNVAWGRGEGRIVVEDSYLDVIDGLFDQGESRLHVDGRFAIGFPRADGGEEIDGRFQLESVPAQTMRDAFSIDGYEIDGPVSGGIELHGEYRRPFGDGTLTMGGPVAWGEPFDRGAARLRFEGDGVRVDGLDMSKGDGRLTGAMFIRWDGTYSVNLDGRGIAMESVASAQAAGMTLRGSARFTVTGAGALAQPRYEVRGTVTDLSVNDEYLGQITGRIDVRDELLALDFEAASSTLAISGSGRVELTPASDADLLFRFTNTTLDPFIRAYETSMPADASAVVSGTLAVSGPLRRREEVVVKASVEQLRLGLFGYAVRNEGPIVMDLDRNVVHIGAMSLRGDQTELHLGGQIDLAEASLDLEVDGDAGLGILQSVLPDVRSSGSTRFTAHLAGTIRQPVVVGDIAVVDGRIRHYSLPHGIDDINGRIVFERDGLRFDELSGVLAGGPVRFGGRVGMRGLRVDELNVTAEGTGMNLRFPEGVRSVVDAQLTLGGDLDDAVLSGTVTVLDAIWLRLFEPSTGFLDFTSGDEVLVPRRDEPVVPLRLDVRVTAPSSLRISDRTVRIVASADLTIGGTYDAPQLFGNAEIDRGEVFFEGNRYRVVRGRLGFSDPTGIDPFLDVEAETDIRVPSQTYRVTLGVTGTMDRLDVELSSDPPLQDFEILSLLLGDVRDPQASELRSLRAQEESRQELLRAGAARLLMSPISSGVGRVVEESFGVDSFEITPTLSDPTGQQSARLLPTARVLIGKRISDRAHVTFSRAVSGANQDLIVVLEYDQNDRLSWILSQNADRTYALDFRVRHAF